MKAREKYSKIFGRIDTLAETVSWSAGVSNMLEWLTWSTNDVLGVTKTKYRKLIVEWSHDEMLKGAGLEEKQQFVSSKLEAEISDSECLNRYDRPASAVATPREALRRAKYFSEDYLNKEFDIFWSLVSDPYLDAYYNQFTDLKGGSDWYTHGNGGLFVCSTNISEMQMDNLSYNPKEKILVANELKLGGKKNPDQLLKYALMTRLLKQRGFIAEDTRLLLLFIGDKLEAGNWKEVLDAEIMHCAKSSKSTAKLATQPQGIEIARAAEYASTTWRDLMSFNNEFISSLKIPLQQVELKLLNGFNETLASKAFMQRTNE